MEADAYARRWELVVAHRERLLPIALARTSCRADAEDAVHEAMLRAVAYEDLDETRLRAFLTTVTIRLCIDQHRRRERDLRAGTAVFHHEREDAGPEPAVCDRAEAAWVATVLATLPERQREVVVARASGADLAETAQRLHLSYRAVESALARARTQVRAAMAAGAAALAAFGRRTRVAAAPATALTALSLTAAVVVGGLPATPPSPSARPPAEKWASGHNGGAVAARPDGVVPTPSPASGGAYRGSAGTRGTARPDTPQPMDTVISTTGPDGHPIAVTTRDTDETTVQMVERCVTGGYTIEHQSGRCTKQENDPGAYPVSDVLNDVVPTPEGTR